MKPQKGTKGTKTSSAATLKYFVHFVPFCGARKEVIKNYGYEFVVEEIRIDRSTRASHAFQS